MEVSGQLHTPATLPPGKEPRYPLDRNIWKCMHGVCSVYLCLKPEDCQESVLNIKCVFQFSLQVLLETFFIPISI
jgi:hypothetical protein